MIFVKADDRVYLKSEKINAQKNILHGFTTRVGGASTGKIEGLNLGFRVGDDEESVFKNYRYVAIDLGMNYNNIVLARQTHTTNIRIVTKNDAGKGITKDSDIFDTDGLITNIPNIPLVVFYADCTPILIADSKKGVIAAIHAGWRGTANGIGKKVVEIMTNDFKCNAEDIFAAIGPSIGPCCFEVQEDTAQRFDERFVEAKPNGRFNIDLWRANYCQLTECGILPKNISMANECTKCKKDLYYSYRAHKEKTGRMGAFIQIKGEK